MSDFISDIRPRPSRRGFMAAAGATAAAMLLNSTVVQGRDGVVQEIEAAAANGPINVQSLRGGISVISGSGGNIAVLPGPDGKLLIDAGIAVSQAKIANALSSISGDPIQHLISTHWHFDHTSGNDWLHKAGATIISHETTRKRLLVRHRVEGWRFTFPAAPKGALPTVLFKKDLTLQMNGATIALDYYEPAHTDCDISVHFQEADVLHVADTWWNGVYPFIDYSSGGTLDGTIEAAEANVARVSDSTIVIPGHGPVGNKAGLIEFRDMLLTIRDRVAAMKESGKSMEQVVAAKPTADFDDRFGRQVTWPDSFAKLVYQGV